MVFEQVKSYSVLSLFIFHSHLSSQEILFTEIQHICYSSALSNYWKNSKVTQLPLLSCFSFQPPWFEFYSTCFIIKNPTFLRGFLFYFFRLERISCIEEQSIPFNSINWFSKSQYIKDTNLSTCIS